MSTVTIYSTPTCHWCHKAKEFFTENNIAFSDYNVAENIEKQKEMIDLTKQMGVPVIRIGETTMIGFNEAGIREALSAMPGATTPGQSSSDTTSS